LQNWTDFKPTSAIINNQTFALPTNYNFTVWWHSNQIILQVCRVLRDHWCIQCYDEFMDNLIMNSRTMLGWVHGQCYDEFMNKVMMSLWTMLGWIQGQCYDELMNNVMISPWTMLWWVYEQCYDEFVNNVRMSSWTMLWRVHG
jgi:hypothetical protein